MAMDMKIQLIFQSFNLIFIFLLLLFMFVCLFLVKIKIYIYIDWMMRLVLNIDDSFDELFFKDKRTKEQKTISNNE